MYLYNFMVLCILKVVAFPWLEFNIFTFTDVCITLYQYQPQPCNFRPNILGSLYCGTTLLFDRLLPLMKEATRKVCNTCM